MFNFDGVCRPGREGERDTVNRVAGNLPFPRQEQWKVAPRAYERTSLRRVDFNPYPFLIRGLDTSCGLRN